MNLFNFSRVGALDHLKWTYQRAFYLVAFFFFSVSVEFNCLVLKGGGGGGGGAGVAGEGILEL